MSFNSLIRFVSAADLIEAPRPDALIEGFIQEQEAVCLYGVPNGGKSFLSLDWALCVATGKPWLDTHEVKMGPVVYMAGEGAASLQVRVQAWMSYHGVTEIPGAYFQTRPLPLRDDEIITEIQAVLEMFAVEEVGAEAPEMQPRLIVVDTLSQFMMGGDENGPDMALFVSNLRRLSQDNNCAVLVVHHTDKLGGHERGHSALRGNMDVMFRCSPLFQENVLTGLDLSNDKQRDAARANVVNLKFKVIDLGLDRKSKPLNSLVVVPTIAPPSTLPEVKRGLMAVLVAMLQLEDVRSEKVHNTSVCDYTGMNRGTVHKRLEKLAQMKLVKHREGKSSLTTLGRAVLDAAGIKREEPEEDE